MPDIETLKTALDSILEIVSQPEYSKWYFYLFILLGITSIIFSILAFLEARKAKQAASEAGTTVKIQTITIELSEIVQRLDTLDMEIEFSTARDLLNEITRRLRRLISTFKNDPEFKTTIMELIDTLGEARNALQEVRPTDSDAEDVVPNAVYYATEGFFSAISGLVADLMGLFEKRTIDTGEH